MVNKNIDERIAYEEVIIKEKLHINLAKQKYADIKVPQGIDVVAPKGSEHGYKKRLSYLIAVTMPVVTICLFVLFINISSAFREYISRVPLFEHIIGVMRIDIGSEKALEKSFLQTINQTVEDKGIKVTINNIIYDRRKMIVSYSFESKEDYKNLEIGVAKFNGLDGKPLKVVTSYGNSTEKDGESSKVKVGTAEILFNDDSITFPKEIIIEFSEFIEEGTDYINKKPIEGDWNFKIKLNETFLNVEPKVLNINKDVNLDKIKFNVKNLKIYPTIADVKLVWDEESEYKIVGFKNPKLVDDKGRSYTSNSGGISNLEYILHFQSSYFRHFRNMSFEAEGVYYIPKEEQFIEVDLKNMKIIDSRGYKLEIDRAASKSFNNTYKNDREDLTIGFKVTDEEFYNARSKDQSDNRLYLQLSEALDENNNRYDASFGIAYSNEQTLFASIKKPENMPEKLRFKVETSTREITAPFKAILK
jgi:hypothetical protein